MIRTTKTASIAIFGLLLAAPFVQERLQPLSIRPLVENRLKTPRPTDWKTLFQNGTPFARKYEEYFNDTYGLRDLLIRAKNQADFRLFRKSEKILIGPDNWLFYKSVVEEQQIALERECDRAFGPMLERFVRLNRALASRGMTLVVLPCPMKNSIYPEMLPDTAPRRPVPNAFDRYRRFLAGQSEIVTVDPFDTLVGLKTSLQVYHKTDFHWTDPAGAHVARMLINKLGSLSGMGDLWSQPIEIRREPLEVGGENLALGLLWPVVEDALFLRSDRIATGLGEYTNSGHPNEWAYRAKEPQPGRQLPTTVMFGDSYADTFLRAGFTAHFSRFQKFSNYDLKTRLAKIPDGTRFVVLQHIETILLSLINPIVWPDGLLAGEKP